MSLRDHPLMRYRGVPSWPPDWVWTGGIEDKRPKGEIGVLRQVVESNIQPSNRCFLFIDYEESSYTGGLTVDYHAFCTQIVRFLQEHGYNRSIAEIGGVGPSPYSLGHEGTTMEDKRYPVFVDGKECGRPLTQIDREGKKIARYDLATCECSLGHRTYVLLEPK